MDHGKVRSLSLDGSTTNWIMTNVPKETDTSSTVAAAVGEKPDKVMLYVWPRTSACFEKSGDS